MIESNLLDKCETVMLICVAKKVEAHSQATVVTPDMPPLSLDYVCLEEYREPYVMGHVRTQHAVKCTDTKQCVTPVCCLT